MDKLNGLASNIVAMLISWFRLLFYSFTSFNIKENWVRGIHEPSILVLQLFCKFKIINYRFGENFQCPVDYPYVNYFFLNLTTEPMRVFKRLA